MQRDSPDDFSRTVLEKRYAEIQLKYLAVNDQIDKTLSEAEKITLRLNAADFLEELRSLDQELISIKHRQKEGSRQRELSQKICQIDFREQVERFKGILDNFDRRGCAGVFVVQDSHAFAGDLLIERLQEYLSANASNFDYCPVGFSSGITLDEAGVLTGLSRHLGLSPKESYGDDDLNEIISKLCKSLKTRQVKFIELKEWHKLPSPDSVLSWLRNTFYPRLNARFTEEVSSQGWRRAYVFVLIVSDDIFPKSCSELWPCIKSLREPFQSLEEIGGVINISLDNWTKDDVEDWLENVGLPDAEIVETAERLYRQGRGFPRMICDAIEKEFCISPKSD